MKKSILSSLLVISFISYALYKRTVSASDLQTITPLSSVPSVATPTISQTAEPLPVTPSASVVKQITQMPRITPTNTPIPTSVGQYKDGNYTGVASDAFYGFIQVKAVISGGKLTDVIFLRYPNDHDRSVFINQQAMPLLKQEAITVQSASVNIVSGATDSSQAFRESLSSALAQAKS
jgi:uncharacterized protein with FMN-binding domain